jgi:periplasmic protein TonB
VLRGKDENMTANGYLEQKTARPLSFGGVVLLHGAAIAAVLLIKGPGWERAPDIPTTIVNVKPDEPPPPEPPPPQPDQPVPQNPPISRLDVPKQIVETPVRSQSTFAEHVVTPPGPIAGNDIRPPVRPPVERLVTVPPKPIERTPVRVEAQFDSRFAGAMQPPYPAVEQRNEREGSVRVRVTIGPDGRVVAIERLSATSDEFWRATERHARSRWRFKPATVDGQPVQGSKVMTVVFRLDG